MPFDHEMLRKVAFTRGLEDGSAVTGLGLSETDPLRDPLHDPLKDVALSTGGRVKKALGFGEKDRLDKAKAAITAMTPAQAVHHHRDVLRDWLTRDQSVETLDFIDDVERGRDDAELKRVYIMPNSSREVNFSAYLRKNVLEKGQPVSSLMNAAIQLLTDPVDRMADDPASIKKIAAKL